jgi:predicted transcriptional regulator
VARRTTLTLEDEVMDRLLDEARKSKRPFKQVVNEAIRAGLDRDSKALEPFRVEARPMGLRKGLNLDDISQLLDDLDGPSAR